MADTSSTPSAPPTKGPGYIEITSPFEHILPGSSDTYPNGVPPPDLSNDSLQTVFADTFTRFASDPCMAYRPQLSKDEYGPYQWITFQQFYELASCLGSALTNVCRLQPQDRAAIFLPNSLEWLVCEHAMIRQSIVSVPLYATFGVQTIAFILRQAEVKVAVCSADLLPTLLSAIETLDLATRTLQSVIIVPSAIDPRGFEKSIPKMESMRLDHLEYAKALELGAKSPSQPVSSKATDIWSIVYTSGTTGEPKGAVLWHRNGLAAIQVALNVPIFRTEGFKGQVHMSYLPLAHVLEREVSLGVLRGGAGIGFFTGSIPRLFDDIAALRPTFLIGVPRVWKRLYDKVMQTINTSGWLTKTMFSWGYSAKEAADNGSWYIMPWDSIIFNKMKEKLGGRCRFIISGGAALSGELSMWLSRCFSLHVWQGYGLTETIGASTLQRPPLAPQFRGSIGFPTPGACVRLADTPEMGYLSTSTPPAGEIWIKGPMVFHGYYNDQAKTAECMEGDWFKTGDIGQLNADGSISIVDRKKNLFKLAQGEYVAAEYLETLFGKSPLLSQVWIHGEPTDTFIVAIVVPNKEALVSEIKKSLPAIAELPFEEQCRTRELRDYILQILVQISKEAKLPGFQVPKTVWIDTEAWTIENDALTPTFKIKRNILKAKYSHELAEISGPVRLMEATKQ